MMIYLETDRLLLRDYLPEDEEDYSLLKSDPETMYYLQDIQLTSREEARQDFTAVLADAASPDRRFYFFRVERKDTGVQIGSIGYTVMGRGPEGKTVHAGYFYLPAYWGQGYGTEAFQRLLAFAFLEDGVYRVTTGCLAENKGSERVMQKCGMVREGVFPDWEYHDGRWKTRVQYRLLKQEYLRKRETRMFSVAIDGPEKALSPSLLLYEREDQPNF